jgi:FkbM family methyltransferase
MFSRILRHPVLYARKALGRVQRRLIVPPQSRTALVNGSVRFEHRKLPFLNDDDYRAMLTGSYDIILCDFLRRHLAPGDIMLDVGANVGFISAVAASRVGTLGEVHSFEPLRECFERLELVRRLNPDFRLVCNQFALGSEEESLPIGFDPVGESRNATLVPGYNTPVRYKVPVKRLDAYIRDAIASPERIKLIKIDVEGFEFAVLMGVEAFLSGTPCRPLIVVEIKPWDLAKIGHNMTEFQDYMERFNYRAYDMVDENLRIDLLAMREMEVVLFRAQES